MKPFSSHLIASSRGASIAAVVIVLLIITGIGVVFVSLFTTGLDKTTGEVSSVRALYSAEAGLESAIARLNSAPASTNWPWQDGYLDKPAGSGTADVEVLEYENRDFTLIAVYRCELIESAIVAVGANPPRTVYASLAWASASNMDLELYNADVSAACAAPPAGNRVATSATADKPESVRYRIPNAAPATLTYTVRVIGAIGDAYRLRIAHPQETNFGTGSTCGQPAGAPFDACMRAVISLGKSGSSRREVFAGFSR